MSPNSTTASVSPATLLRSRTTTTVSVTNERETWQCDALLELICERLLIEEDVGIAEALVKAVFHLFDALYCALEVAIARKHDDRRVCLTIRHERRIVRPVVLLRNLFRGSFWYRFTGAK